MVETGGLENRLRGDSHGGSNPSSSANALGKLSSENIAAASMRRGFIRQDRLAVRFDQ